MTKPFLAAVRRAAVVLPLLCCPIAWCGTTAVEGAACAAPAALADHWPIGEPAATGFDALKLCTAMRRVADGTANIHGVIVERHGRLIAELYRTGPDVSILGLWTVQRQFGPTVLHDMRSITKSVVALLVGIAESRSVLSVARPALDYFPEYAELRATPRAAITLEHLLTMTSGLHWEEEVATYGTLANDETRLFWDWSPSKYVLSRAVDAAPGEQFNYSGGNTTLLAEILARTTRKPLTDFAREELFDPLGITEWEWKTDLYGRPLAFAGLRLRPRDLAKIGRMLLDGGRWHGQQVVPADWIARSWHPYANVPDGRQYGYQWWLGRVHWRDRDLAWIAGVGNGGQRLYMIPELDLVIVITAGAYNQTDIGLTLRAVLDDVVAAVLN